MDAALKGDPVAMLRGGHDHAGGEAAPLDQEALDAFLATIDPGVTAVAVAARFATRNPAHETAAARRVADVAGLPATASHTLSAKLNGPKRALTALLNARLVGMIDRLIGRAQDVLQELGIAAPLMVVRGDGALMSAAAAHANPIETILSGRPAASIVGARWLTGAETALVSDIGGTTTDIALLRDGRPSIDPDGAQVGPFRTMVEAVAMRTSGPRRGQPGPSDRTRPDRRRAPRAETGAAGVADGGPGARSGLADPGSAGEGFGTERA